MITLATTPIFVIGKLTMQKMKEKAVIIMVAVYPPIF